MAYQYKGTLTTEREDPAKPAPKPVVRKGGKPGRKPIYGTGCGSSAGYSAHKRRGEHACDPCKAAEAAKKMRINRAKGITTRALVPLDAQCPNCGHHIIEAVA